MTILFFAYEPDEAALLVADTRKSRDGKTLNDTTVKIGVVYSANARLIYGVVGLHEANGFTAHVWIREALSRHITASDFNNLSDRLAEDASLTFDGFPTTVSPEEKCFNLILAGIFNEEWHAVTIGNTFCDLANPQ